MLAPNWDKSHEKVPATIRYGVKQMHLLKKHLLTVGLGLSLCTTFSDSSQATCSPNTYLGSICYMAGNFCPIGFAKVDGSVELVSGNEALYSLIGGAFGGNFTLMQLPDLRARTPVGVGLREDDAKNIYRGGKSGDNSINLKIENIAQHQHSLPTTFNRDFKGKLGARDEAPNINTPTGSTLSKANNTLSPPYKSNAQQQIPMAADSLYGAYDMSGLKATHPSVGGNHPVHIQGERLALTSCIAVGSNMPYPPHPKN